MELKLRKASKHIIFWLLYLVVWSFHDLNYNVDLLDNLKTNSGSFFFYALFVYANLYFLIPKFLLKKKITSYVILLIIAIIATTFITSYYLSFYFESVNLPTSIYFSSVKGKVSIATEVIISLCLSMTLFLIDEWFKKEQLIKDIEQKQLEKELGLSNNQINPHFLFNSLKSIYTIMDEESNTKSNKSHIFIKSDGMVVKVFIDEITYIETASDYIYINTIHKERYLTLVSLKHMQEELPKEKFIRVHRYYLIGINHVRKLEGNLIYIGKTKIKISRALKNEVYEAIIGNKLIER